MPFVNNKDLSRIDFGSDNPLDKASPEEISKMVTTGCLQRIANALEIIALPNQTMKDELGKVKIKNDYLEYKVKELEQLLKKSNKKT
jgi:hypothetical protein